MPCEGIVPGKIRGPQASVFEARGFRARRAGAQAGDTGKASSHLARVTAWHRMARTRYRGLERVTIQVLLTRIVAKAKKMPVWLAAREASEPSCGVWRKSNYGAFH